MCACAEKTTFLCKDDLTIVKLGRLIMRLRATLPNHVPACMSEFFYQNFLWTQNVVGPKYFWAQNFIGLTFLDNFPWPNIFLDQIFYRTKSFEPKLFYDQKLFWIQIFLDQHFWVPLIFGTNIQGVRRELT